MGLRVVGKKLRKRREESGLSQEALGKMLGVTRYTVIRWEHGTSRPEGYFALRRLAEFIGVTVEDLVAMMQRRDRARTPKRAVRP